MTNRALGNVVVTVTLLTIIYLGARMVLAAVHSLSSWHVRIEASE
ncbi:MAG: hypothetical protein ACP5QR_05065 [Rhizomicrobium sp.]